jgi:nitroreductase
MSEVLQAGPVPGLLPAIASRRSPRAFAPLAIPDAVLVRLFEAARWAPSSRNAQPWRFVLAVQGDPQHAAVAATLTGRNRAWAPAAPVLLLVVARTVNERGQADPGALYDVGQAVAQLVLQATHEGLVAHQMGGFDTQAARAACAVPPDHEPVVVIALGRRGDPAQLPPELAAGEDGPRRRQPLAEWVFTGRFGAAWPPVTLD